MRSAIQLGSLVLVSWLGACTSSPDFLFPSPIEGVPGIQHLGTITPIDPLNDDIAANTIYGEIGPTGSTALGGLTFEFIGTNAPVCVWVDPETAYWNQSVARSGRNKSYREPDNIFDDGDLDVFGGQSVFYTGTPGSEMGQFQIRYTDPLGEIVPIDFIECSTYGGRGAPEACQFTLTTLGVRYTVVLDAWSTPLDDNRLGFGLIVSQGTCANLVSGAGSPGSLGPPGVGGIPTVAMPFAECLIQGESVKPSLVPEELHGERARNRGLPSPSWLGRGEVTPWELSVAFESDFCTTNDDTPTLANFCRTERANRELDNTECSWDLDASEEGTGVRCFCGDPRNTPRGGSD